MRFHVFESLHAIHFGSGRMTSLDAVEDLCKRPEKDSLPVKMRMERSEPGTPVRRK
jgi:hypothetical protein